MKLTKTIAVVGLLALSSTAASASTFGWSTSWSDYSSSNQRGQRVATLASSLFDRYAHIIQSNPHVSNQAQAVLSRIQQRLAERNPGNTGGSASEVPLPASGLLLVGALGALALRRRQKS